MMKKFIERNRKSCQLAMFQRIWQSIRRAISLHHAPTHDFACSQWQKTPRPNLVYIIYRFTLFLLVISVAIASFVSQKLPMKYNGPIKEVNYMKWFIYLTNWGFMLIIGQSLLALFLCVKSRNQSYVNTTYETSEEQSRTPLLCQLYWLFFITATDLAFVITFVYWTCVHDPEHHEVTAINILVHGCNSIIMLIELFVTAHPVRVAHALYSTCVGVIYGLFSAIYWAAGGTDRVGFVAIYTDLNWETPGSALSFIGVCLCVLLVSHGLATIIVKSRIYIAKYIYHKRLNNSADNRFTLPVF